MAVPEGTTTTLPAPVEAETEADPQAEESDLCPVHESIKIIGRKWHLAILWELSKKPLGFNGLKLATPGISAKMLSQSLAELEQHELVVREIVSQRPLRVAYHLTPRATEVAEVFTILQEWGTRHGLCERP